MARVDIYDPAMCCSTGICGPSIDPELLRIAAVVETLKEAGVEVARHGLSQEPQDFVANKEVTRLMNEEGSDVLPITYIDGRIISKRTYPSNDVLEAMLEVKLPKSETQDCDCTPANDCGCIPKEEPSCCSPSDGSGSCCC